MVKCSQKYVANLTSATSNQLIGYEIGGAVAGPTVVVAGFRQASEPSFDRIANIPSISRLKGRLLLVCLESLDLTGIQELTELNLGFVDEILFLQAKPEEKSFQPENVDLHFWKILRLCTDLGMISGRGIKKLAIA